MYEIVQGDATTTIANRCKHETFDGCLCDPPYGYTAFTKRPTQTWETLGVPPTELWLGIYRALRPGALLLAASGTRTYHRIASCIEEAGFEIKDQFLWLYTQASATGVREGYRLKPACEPYVVARKPLRAGATLDGVFNPIIAKASTVPSNVGMDERIMRRLDVYRETIGEELASRFFFCNKATKTERGKDVDHPTLKPVALTQYLATLILQPRAKRLIVPFSGAGSEMIGAMRAGWKEVIGFEREMKYVNQAHARIERFTGQEAA